MLKATSSKREKLFNSLRQIINPKKQINSAYTSAEAYWRKLPKFIEIQSKYMSKHLFSPTILKERELENFIKDSYLRPEVIVPIFEEIEQWVDIKESILKTILLKIIPRLLLISSLKKSENKEHSIKESLHNLIRMIKKNKIQIKIMFCPPYTYQIQSNGLVTSSSGAFRNKAGKRFKNTILLLKETFQPLIIYGIKINLKFISYSGEGNHEDLIEITIPTRKYYKGRENEMMTNINLAFSDAHAIVKNVLNKSGISHKMISIEKNHSKAVREVLNQFEKKHSQSKKDAYSWLSKFLNVKLTWLDTFIKSEHKEALIMGLSADNKEPYKIALNGLSRAILYYKLLEEIKNESHILIDLESQCYTMQDSLNQNLGFIPAVVTGNAFDSPFGIRGPFEFEQL